MSIEIKVPSLPESVADATIATWHKKAGDAVRKDENLVDLETDKVVLEVPSPVDGVLKEILKPAGSTVKMDELIGIVEAGAVAAAPAKTATVEAPKSVETAIATDKSASPAVRRVLGENDLSAAQVDATGKGNKITKEDVQRHLSGGGSRKEERVPMSRIRQRIAERLLEVKQNTAMLTTFNEVNMKPIMELRAKYKAEFEKLHGVKLGFMSFFTKAVVEALKFFQNVNASIDGTDIIYHGYCDIGIAISSDRGLVVPILRNAEHLTMSGIELAIQAYAKKAKEGKLSLEDMQGGTFTITNGGTFGSMLSTPILNAPQSAILGMHNIVERPVAENGVVVIRPIMYLALSYDHRIIDGKESVSFLKMVKETLEDPARLLLEV